MIQVNCHVVDCKSNLRLVCQKTVIEVSKMARCQSYVHIPGYERRNKK